MVEDIHSDAERRPTNEHPSFALAAAALVDMRRFGVEPSPANYELWFNHLAGHDPELTASMSRLLASGVISSADLAHIRTEFPTSLDLDRQLLGTSADELRETTEQLIEHVGEGHSATRSFGEALKEATRHLTDTPTMTSLLDAVTTLAVETARASERNRVLEHQLSTSSLRITRLRQSLAEAKQEATTDALTGIANRRAFDLKLSRAIAQARADGGAAFSLLLLDVDHFKSFNDTHGHKVGDLVLRLIARLLTDSMKGCDTVARYGGEEFAVLMAGAESSAAASVARKINKTLSGKRLINKASGQNVGQVTISVGVAQFHCDDCASTLMERADVALYEAKRTGRNRVCTEPGRELVPG